MAQALHRKDRQALHCKVWLSSTIRGAMTWIRVIPFEEDPALGRARAAQQKLYPIEYAEPTHPQLKDHEGIVGSHSLIPDAMFHAFAAFGALMSPELPLTRRQHEMITTVVSALNRCQY
jgi:hypothetical protein